MNINPYNQLDPGPNPQHSVVVGHRWLYNDALFSHDHLSLSNDELRRGASFREKFEPPFPSHRAPFGITISASSRKK